MFEQIGSGSTRVDSSDQPCWRKDIAGGFTANNSAQTKSTYATVTRFNLWDMTKEQ
jgi:hypothetical protein